MKLPRPASPFERIEHHGESFTLDTSGKILVLPSGNPDILPSHNEYTLNSNRLSIAESPFGGLKGSGSPDYCVGTVNIIEGDGVYLQDVNGQNSSKTLSAGKLKELNLMSVDTVNHAITEEFIVANTAESNNPTVIDNCDSVDGWIAVAGTCDFSIDNGRLKAVITPSSSLCEIQKTFTPALNLTNAHFLFADIELSVSKPINMFVRSSGGLKRYDFIASTENKRYIVAVQPTITGTQDAMPKVVTALDLSSVVDIRIKITGLTAGEAITIYIDNITADTAKSATIEAQVPDNLSATSLSLYTHDGTTYQLCSTHSLDGAYSQIAQTSANCTFLDGTKLDDVYGAGLGRAVFPKGSAGDTKAGSSGNITYSENRGTDKRIGLKVDLPPSDNGRTNFNKVRLKLVINYTDTVGNIVPDLSGNNNTGTIVGGVTKLNDGGLKFDGLTGYIDCGNVTSLHGISALAVYVDFVSRKYNYRLDVFPAIIGKRVAGGVGPFSLRVDGGTQKVTMLVRNSSGTYSTVSTNSILDTNVRYRILGVWDGSQIRMYVNGTLQTQTAELSGVTETTTETLKIGVGRSPSEFLDFDLYNAKIYSTLLTEAEETALASGQNIQKTALIHYAPTVSNMGSTTHVFADSTNTSYGLQNLSKPWIALYDPASNLIDFYLFTYRPKNLEFKRDESGTIHELKLFPGNGQIYHGRVTHFNPALDSDSNNIPDCLEASIEGSITKFLQSYGMVI
jgi:hypothetical protein